MHMCDDSQAISCFACAHSRRCGFAVQTFQRRMTANRSTRSPSLGSSRSWCDSQTSIVGSCPSSQSIRRHLVYGVPDPARPEQKTVQESTRARRRARGFLKALPAEDLRRKAIKSQELLPSDLFCRQFSQHKEEATEEFRWSAYQEELSHRLSHFLQEISHKRSNRLPIATFVTTSRRTS